MVLLGVLGSVKAGSEVLTERSGTVAVDNAEYTDLMHDKWFIDPTPWLGMPFLTMATLSLECEGALETDSDYLYVYSAVCSEEEASYITETRLSSLTGVFSVSTTLSMSDMTSDAPDVNCVAIVFKSDMANNDFSGFSCTYQANLASTDTYVTMAVVLTVVLVFGAGVCMCRESATEKREFLEQCEEPIMLSAVHTHETYPLNQPPLPDLSLSLEDMAPTAPVAIPSHPVAYPKVGYVTHQTHQTDTEAQEASDTESDDVRKMERGKDRNTLFAHTSSVNKGGPSGKALPGSSRATPLPSLYRKG
ncbi:hypothetical protein KIPB_003234 [Kipferlia bialata]|uniref:Uncharacterized protein n=1 Tax=Kipferlia bialata TaxID=797122 RepID=A0A9K3CRQ7_9EUKA|nr:hypothetical protein KIPB_002416 [Kipferlia bialata]GIQ81900.1 hypothetical protein KIPB_002942 [Kipferlia bialata]GIQ82148.1 hypothetical protein KIPB_003234 [Kipferlia bialata]|eukprot:g2416.t1